MILVLNAGSSSLKFALFDGEKRVIHGNHKGALRDLLQKLPVAPAAVGHRVVMGGEAPVKISKESLAKIKNFLPLAPLHLPKELAFIEELGDQFPQVACFDTSFHKTLPELAKRFPLPDTVGVQRYGFHGLSYEYLMTQLENPPARIILAHLGSGASLAAVKESKCIDTTMGLTPTGGIMMGTRSGDLDPGILLYLLREKKMSLQEIEELVEHKAGLLGVSGFSSDVQVLQEKRGGQFAIDLFIYQVAKAVGALATALGGLDLLIFTAGIGEHCEKIRTRIVERLSFLPAFETRVIPTNEELMIARHTKRVLEW